LFVGKKWGLDRDINILDKWLSIELIQKIIESILVVIIFNDKKNSSSFIKHYLRLSKMIKSITTYFYIMNFLLLTSQHQINFKIQQTFRKCIQIVMRVFMNPILTFNNEKI